MKISCCTNKLVLHHDGHSYVCDVLDTRMPVFTCSEGNVYNLVDTAFLVRSNRQYLMGLVDGCMSLLGFSIKRDLDLAFTDVNVSVNGHVYTYLSRTLVFNDKLSYAQVALIAGVPSQYIKGIIDGSRCMQGPYKRALHAEQKRAKV